MSKGTRSAGHHLRKARTQFRSVKDKGLGDALRRLATALIRLNEELKDKKCK